MSRTVVTLSNFHTCTIVFYIAQPDCHAKQHATMPMVDKGNVVETLRQRRRNFKDSTSDVFEVPSLEDLARPDFNAAFRIEWGLRA